VPLEVGIVEMIIHDDDEDVDDDYYDVTDG